MLVLVKGDWRLTSWVFLKFSEDIERRTHGVQKAFWNKEAWHSSLFVLSFRIGVVSPDVIANFLPTKISSLNVESAKLNELHSSEVGVRVGSESGFAKNVSIPSLKLWYTVNSDNNDLVGARTLLLFGLLLTRCWSVKDVLSSSVNESHFSSSAVIFLESR